MFTRRFVITTAVTTAVSTSVVSSYLAYGYGKSILQNLPSDKFPNESTTPLNKISSPIYANKEELKTAIHKIGKLLRQDQVTESKIELDYHTRNEFTPHEPKSTERPKFVIYPEATQQVSEILKILNFYKVPVVPFSGGTSLEGHFFSTRSGVVIDTSRMKKVKRINHDDLDVEVEAGVNWVNLNEQLKAENLMIGSDCGPDGLISGMINTNASGINASKYGAMISNVINLTVVLPDGKIIKTRQRPRKASNGYSLTHLFIGSEGTLGIVTEATLKLHPISKFETVIVGQFPTLLDSTNTVSQIYRNGIHPNAIELLDPDMMACTNYSGYFSKKWDEVPTIFFKIGGLSKIMVDEQIKVLKEISIKNNCTNFIKAVNKEEGDELFSARKNAFYAILNYGRNEIDENVRLWVTDIAVPLSKLSPVLIKINELIRKSGLKSIILAHAGDANFHCDVFYKEDEKEKCEKLINEMMDLGLNNEGTSSGEHGIGNGKRNFLIKELGIDSIDLMRRLKFAIDPNRIMNPDKIFKIDPNDDGEY